MGCRAIFDVSQGPPDRQPWAAKRCPNNIDPNPADTSRNACLTDGQISTLQFVYSRYPLKSALANGVMSFGMWLPNIRSSGQRANLNRRACVDKKVRASDAPLFAHIAVPGVTAGLMRDINANPLDFVETECHHAPAARAFGNTRFVEPRSDRRSIVVKAR